MSSRLWGLTLDKGDQAPETWAKPDLTPANIAYAPADAVACRHALAHVLPRIKADGALPALAVTVRAIPAVAEIELQGLPVDQSTLDSVICDLRAGYAENMATLAHDPAFPRTQGGLRKPDLIARAHEALAGLPEDQRPETPPDKMTLAELVPLYGPPVLSGDNLAAWVRDHATPEELADWELTEKTKVLKVGPKAMRLHGGANPAFRPVILAQEAGKLVSDKGMVTKIRQRVREDRDGRLRGSVTLCAAKTGRGASSDPNLQNLPRKGGRHFVMAPPGRLLVKCDYSGMELRVAAAIAADADMLAILSDLARDLHLETAAASFGIAPDGVTPDQRQVGKTVNFLSLYGGSGFGLRRRMLEDAALSGDDPSLVPSADQGAEYIAGFWERRQGLADWRDCQFAEIAEIAEEIAASGKALQRTPLGRPVPCPPTKRQIASADRYDRRRPQYSRTLALNAPIQGGAAECAMAAMPLLLERLPASACRVGFVHDEFTAECAAEDAEATAAALAAAMLDGALKVIPGLPVAGLVKAEIAERWQVTAPTRADPASSRHEPTRSAMVADATGRGCAPVPVPAA
ncbi:DNA polymerase [Paracoccus sp. Z330]|uniref:DNA-directed DNA polymerase n=1 Tax=Paracoccus onchidii TaxID=3017813 RepID=A0ABT4ZBA7_9RHOB|nr:DNA polymerase [Paracoccus onchidii]MDB6176650.1 DNA polymerase [Paracoccus onchidii]